MGLRLFLGAAQRLCGRSGHAQAPKPDAATLAKTGILERLLSSGYGVPATAKLPGFIADAGWPQKLPNNWLWLNRRTVCRGRPHLGLSGPLVTSGRSR